MLAGLVHKRNWRKAREATGKDSSKPNMVTGGHARKKCLRYFDVEQRIASLMPGDYRLTIEHLDELPDETTMPNFRRFLERPESGGQSARSSKRALGALRSKSARRDDRGCGDRRLAELDQELRRRTK
ncbi:hypothetical protein LG3211_5243 [Lysobacter gummosus]|nr:hypothetical protein LG3211_5243 [Lysobacter gummosus]